MTRAQENLKLSVDGHLLIRDISDSEPKVLVNKHNAIHKENMVITMAGSLANKEDYMIYYMQFGTGGATVDSLGEITYSSPNVEGPADVYNPVFLKAIEDASTGGGMGFRHVDGMLFSDVEIRCILGLNEPSGQPLSDTTASTNLNESVFVFDEIGLKNKNGDLLTHVVFSPVEKAMTRIIEVIYTLRVILE